MKKILIIIIIIFVSLIGINKLKADVSYKFIDFKMGNTSAVKNNVYIPANSSRDFNISYTLYNIQGYYPYYLGFEICSSGRFNPSSGDIYYDIYSTGEQCMYTGSSYTGGRKYIVLSRRISYQTSSLQNVNINHDFTFHFIESSSVEYLNSYILTENEYNTYMENIKQNKVINDKLDDLNNKQNQTNEKLDNIDNTIKDDNIDDAQNSANDFFGNFDNNDYGLSDIVKMPLDFINKITSATCTPLSFPLPFVDTNVTLPCMYSIYETHFGDILSVYQTITFGMVAYWVCINIFRMVKNFKNPDSDEVEVLDL